MLVNMIYISCAYETKMLSNLTWVRTSVSGLQFSSFLTRSRYFSVVFCMLRQIRLFCQRLIMQEITQFLSISGLKFSSFFKKLCFLRVKFTFKSYLTHKKIKYLTFTTWKTENPIGYSRTDNVSYLSLKHQMEIYNMFPQNGDSRVRRGNHNPPCFVYNDLINLHQKTSGSIRNLHQKNSVSKTSIWVSKPLWEEP